MGQQIERVSRNSCKKWLEREKESTEGNQNIAISYDMGWQKRGNARNSRTEQVTAVGRSTEKIVDYQTKNTACRSCESAAKAEKEPQKHDCRINHEGSSKSVEAAAAVDIYERAKKDGVHYNTFIGDEDSTTISHVRQNAGTQTNVRNKIVFGIDTLYPPPKKNKNSHNKRPFPSKKCDLSNVTFALIFV